MTPAPLAENTINTVHLGEDLCSWIPRGGRDLTQFPVIPWWALDRAVVKYNYPTLYTEPGSTWHHYTTVPLLADLTLLGFDLASRLCGTKESECENYNADQQRLIQHNE